MTMNTMTLYITLPACHNRVTVKGNRAKVDKMNNQNLIPRKTQLMAKLQAIEG